MAKAGNIKKKIQYPEANAYLLQFAVACADKSHRVAAIVIRRHRGHAVVFVDKERDSLDGAGSP